MFGTNLALADHQAKLPRAWEIADQHRHHVKSGAGARAASPSREGMKSSRRDNTEDDWQPGHGKNLREDFARFRLTCQN
jgi:hypothetical protein